MTTNVEKNHWENSCFITPKPDSFHSAALTSFPVSQRANEEAQSSIGNFIWYMQFLMGLASHI